MASLLPVLSYYVSRTPLDTDYQVQRQNTVDTTADMLASAQADPLAVGRTYIGYLINVITDQSGNTYYNLTAYFADPAPVPHLNPENLNDPGTTGSFA